MEYVLGIDLGTGSVKALLAEVPTAHVVGITQKNYRYAVKDRVRAEQDPQALLESTFSAIRGVLRLASVAGSRVVAVGLSAQMHGTVLYEAEGKVLGNIITWEDQRVSPGLLEEVRRLGRAAAERSGCDLATGYCGLTLLALKRLDKALFKRIRHVLLPGDWLRRELTGCSFLTDTSNGSSSGVFDTERRRWNVALLTRLSLNPDVFPQVRESFDVGGRISQHVARRTGLRDGTPVTVGGGDQPLSMIGSGICGPRDGLIINIGTGGQVATVRKSYVRDEELITFCFPGGGYSVLGATLSAGAALRWWESLVAECGAALHATSGAGKSGGGAYALMSRVAQDAKPGAGGVRFLPLLAGSRAQPHLKAAFSGLNPDTRLSEMTRAVMEGVTFELYRLYKMLMRRRQHAIVGAGGGFSSHVWGQIVADIFANPISLTSCQEQAALGAALLAGVMIGVYKTPQEACSRVAFRPRKLTPIAHNVASYRRVWEERYRNLFRTPPE